MIGTFSADRVFPSHVSWTYPCSADSSSEDRGYSEPGEMMVTPGMPVSMILLTWMCPQIHVTRSPCDSSSSCFLVMVKTSCLPMKQSTA